MSTEIAYQELGLAPGASEAEVKAAWRRLVSRWHPDRNDSRAAVEKMQRINQAFELLRDVAGIGAPRQASGSGAPPASPAAPTPEEPPAAETGMPARPQVRRVRLTLEEAALGCVQILRGRSSDRCGVCSGTGRHAMPADCTACGGSGQVHQRAWYGWMASTVTCGDCEGSGRLASPCTPCDGTGKRPAHRYEVKVRIPPGVRGGDLLSVPGGGSGPAGGFELKIEWLPHPFFQLDDEGTVRCELPVDGFRWIAGQTVEVPTLEGLQPLALRRDECIYRLPGRGFPASRRGPRGDLVLIVRPVFPSSWTAEQRALLDRLIAATEGAGSDGPLVDWQRRLGTWARDTAPVRPARRGSRSKP
ncbi:DnaJ C-terminal domain-containing protein [Aquincola sp. MAHUQ-54]|uniref:DnaJ C-terminal domain-containing protein n=1 Tax=Aquincola agrisoli TaxID=3119538 RepID=A0AAW9QIU5_9BURK